MVTLTSSSSTPKTSFDFMKNNNSHSIYLPFSSPSSSSCYLSSKEEAFVTTKKLMGPRETLNMSINQKEEELGGEKKIVKKASEEPEIGVFGAEKYFNGDMDSDQGSSVLSLSLTNPDVERIIVDPKQSAKKSTGTPSVRSESSWDSQSVLIQNKLVNSCNSSLQEKKKNDSGQTQKVRNNKKSFLANYGCKCACSDGNSVDVDEKISVKRSSDPDISVFTARKIKNQMDSSVNMNTELIKIQKQDESSQRKSLEVFGSPINIEKKRTVVQKKLTLLRPWESRTEEEDTKSEESDTSADLFEIESLTGKPKPFLTRQGSDPASPTCYAPSEVSVEWSIVTASVADFSVMSECATSPVRRNPSSQIPRIPITAKSAPQRRNSSSSGGSGFLLSCKSHKSVRVSGDSDRRDSMNKTQPSYAPRLPMETTKPKSFETRRRISNSSVS